MGRDEASAFLMDDCIFRVPLSRTGAEEVWQAHKAIVDALPSIESPFPRKIPLSDADLKAARKFRAKYPGETSITDVVSLNPMDLVVHQLWISTAIAERYKDMVAPDKWHRTALLDPPPASGLKWRRQETSIVFDLPKFEYLLTGPFAPDGSMRPGTALDFVSVAFHAERALLISGYHRAFAAAEYARNSASPPRGLLFGVSNCLDLLGPDADETRRIVEAVRPPRLADFFDDRLAVPVMLRKRRYQMRIHVEVVAIDEELGEESDRRVPSPVGSAAPPASLPNVNAILEDGLRHYHAGRIDAAMAHFRCAVFLRPDSAEANNAMGAALARQEKISEAAEFYSRALALKPDYGDAHFNLARVRALQGNPDEAIFHHRRVIAMSPDHADAHQQLGYALTCKGRFAEAMVHCNRALAINPDLVEAHCTRAEIKTFRRGDSDLAALERLATEGNLSDEKRTLIHFALAKALEDGGDFFQAFEYLSKGNALKRGLVDYDEPAVFRKFDGMMRAFDAALIDRFREIGSVSSVPIFVLGMPRSGSTLLEQILASHPQVHAGGELDYMLVTANRVLERSRCAEGPEDIQVEFNSEILRNGAESYLGHLCGLAEGKARVVDKMPGNFFNVGLIHLMLPNARIIHTVRNPIDTCVSCYAKLFRISHNYSYNLGELGRYYRRYAEMMEHWRSVLPAGSMLEVVYENVVEDLEGQARRLIDYCGLPWDHRCIEFHRTDRNVNTLSNFQVRQPLFRSSVQRWRRFEFGLAPLFEALRGTIQWDAANGQGREDRHVVAHLEHISQLREPGVEVASE
jgi:tetratricopeptide (TPR) repeat protein